MNIRGRLCLFDTFVRPGSLRRFVEERAFLRALSGHPYRLLLCRLRLRHVSVDFRHRRGCEAHSRLYRFLVNLAECVSIGILVHFVLICLIKLYPRRFDDRELFQHDGLEHSFL